MSPESKLFLKKRSSIQNLVYELVDSIKFLSITPPRDLSDMYTSDAIAMFDTLIKAQAMPETLLLTKIINSLMLISLS